MGAFDRASRNLFNILEQAAKFDSWGQRLEASEAYQKFHEECSEVSLAALEEEDRKAVDLIINHARRRGEILQLANINSTTEDVNHQQIGADIETLRELIAKLKHKKLLKRKSSAAVTKVVEEGGLLPPIRPKVIGNTYLTIRIDKIGLKDALTYVDPFITVSLKDERGSEITVTQSTPPSELYEEKYIIFNEDVHVQKPVEEILPNYAIFFEFNHFKARKNKISTKCFAFLEPDEIQQKTLSLELYQKPVDYTRRKLYLLTEKKLFLHISLTLVKA